MIRRNYGRSLRGAVAASGAPYGYTVTIWTSGALLIGARGLPDLLDALMFMAGAVAGYALVGGIAFGGLGMRSEGPPPRLAWWGNLHFLSIGFAITASYLASHGIHNLFAWPATGFVATTVYLLVLGVEHAAAGRGPKGDHEQANPSPRQAKRVETR